MRIPNKFNGYSADNIRLYNDPVTLTAVAAGMEGAGAAAALGAGTAAAGTAATGAALGLGAGAGLGAGTMAGTMLGATGAELGTTAALGAANTAALGGAGGAGILQAAAPEVANEVARNQVLEAFSKEGLGQNLPEIAKVAGEAPNGINPTAFTPGAPPVTPPVTPPAMPSAPGMGEPIASPHIPNVPTGSAPPSTAYQGSIGPANISDADIASKVASQQPNQFVEGIMQSDVGQMAKTGYDALSSGFDTAMKFAQKNPLLTSVGINAAQRLFQEEPKKENYKRKDMSGFSASTPETVAYAPIYKPTAYAVGGPVERMSAMNSISGNTMYPQAGLQTPMYSNPMVQRPVSSNVVNQGIDTNVDPYTGQERFAKGGEVNPYLKQLEKEEKDRQEQADSEYKYMQSKGAAAARTTRERSRTQLSSSPYEAAVRELQALGKKYKIPVAAPAKTSVDVMGDPESDVNAANGGIMHGLGGYSDGGRLLRGPGDGVSDSIPAVIGRNQPARLADGEFVVPARIVSELGNGSTEAGARKLYAMMERIQASRKKSIGKKKVAVNSKADKHLPA